MGRGRNLVLAAAGLVALVSPMSARTRGSDAQDRVRDQSNVRIVWPSAEFRTLQAAVDAAPDGATLMIGPGVHRMDQPVFVRGKALVIAGAGSGRIPAGRTPSDPPTEGQITHLAGPAPRPVADDRGELILRGDAVVGLLNLVAARVIVRHLKLSGFDAGIVSRNDERGVSAPLRVEDVAISDTGRGILSQSAGSVSVRDITIEHTTWNAISIGPKQFSTPIGPAFSLLSALITCTIPTDDSSIASPLGAGIYVANTLATIQDAVISGCSGGGIVGDQSYASVTNCDLLQNRKFGIIWLEGVVHIQACRIADTAAINGAWGDGISVWLTQATILGSLIAGSQRAGISTFGALAAVGDTGLVCSGLDMTVEIWNGVPSDIESLGGVQCGCGGSQWTCDAVSATQLVPPLLGGLE